MCFHHQVGEFAFETSGAHDVVVNPVIVAAAGFAEQDAVIFEAVFSEPVLGDFSMRFGAAGEEKNDVAFVVPAVEHRQSVGIWKHSAHAFGFFVGHIVADGAVYVDEKIFDVLGKHGTNALALFVESLLKRLFCMLLINHRVNFTQR